MADGDFIELAETIATGTAIGPPRQHDARSRNFPAAVAPISDVKHVRHGKPFDQGDLGSCTGNAMAGAHDDRAVLPRQTACCVEANAVQLYEQATHLRPDAGQLTRPTTPVRRGWRSQRRPSATDTSLRTATRSGCSTRSAH